MVNTLEIFLQNINFFTTKNGLAPFTQLPSFKGYQVPRSLQQLYQTLKYLTATVNENRSERM